MAGDGFKMDNYLRYFSRDGSEIQSGGSNSREMTPFGKSRSARDPSTALDRLFKKNFLDRYKSERAFRYSPRCSRDDWERSRADSLLAGFLCRQEPSRDLLISCLVEAVGQYDEALLDDLEKKIRAKRKELFQKGKR